MRKILTLFLVACAVVQTFAGGPRRSPGDVVYTQNFTDGLPSDFKSYAIDGKGWEINTSYMASGVAAVQGNALYGVKAGSGTIDVWCILTTIHLSAGVQYSIKYKAFQERTDSSPKDLYAYILTENSEEFVKSLGTETAIAHTSGLNSTSPKEFEYIFSVPSDGDYYLAFRAYGSVGGYYGIYVDDVEIKESVTLPAAATNFTATPAEKGQMAVNLSWTNPSLTNAGTELSSIDKITITCGTREIVLDSSDYLEPGAEVTYTDILPDSEAAGKFTYKIAAYLADNAGPEVSVTSTWVGKDKPRNVSNFKATVSPDNKYVATLSWEQPTDGQNSGYVDMDAIRYRIERNGTPIATKYTEKSFTDSEEKEYGNYQYTVYVTDENDVEVGPTYGRGSATLLMGYGMNIPYFFDFENLTDFNNLFKNNNPAGYYSGWSRASDYSKASNGYALEAKRYYEDLDAWIFTPPFNLKSGKNYAISFDTWGKSVSADRNINIEVSLAEGTENDNVTSAIGDATVSYSDTRNNIYYFSVNEDGSYNIAFHATFNGSPTNSTQYYAYLDNLKIEEVVETPLAPENVVAIPDADGAKQVKLSWTNPVNNVTGAPLSGNLSKIEIYRNEDDAPAVTLQDEQYLEVGKEISYLDILPDTMQEDGYVTYTIKPYLGENTKDFATITTWLGIDTPVALNEVTLSGKNGAFKVTWDAAKGEHGTTLDPEKVKFEITRLVNGESELLTSEATGNEYTDNYSSEELASLSYEVAVILRDSKSEATQSNTLKIGSISLPFADSFAGPQGPQIDDNKWETEITKGSYNWTAASGIGSTTSSLTSPTADNDNGCAYYNYNQSQPNNGARLITMPISKSSSTSPVVDFYLYRPTFSGTWDDVLKLEISIDGQAWQDIEGAEFHRNPVEGDPAFENPVVGWYHYSIPISSSLPEDCETYRISFTAVSGYGYIMGVDAVRIFNLAGSDLEIASLTAPEQIVSGNDLELTVKVTNNGGSTVSADDYTLVVESEDFPTQQFVIETEDIPSLSSKDFNVLIPITAEEAYDCPVYTFQARVNLEGDEVADNNESEVVSVQTAFLEYDRPENVKAKYSENDNNVTIEWDSVKDFDYEPVNITESFEEFTNGYPGPYNGFVVLDLDGVEGQTNFSLCQWPTSDDGYDYDAKSFTVVAPKVANSSSTTQFTQIDGTKSIAVPISGPTGSGTTPSSYQENDWIISPKLNCGKGALASLNLDFLAAFAKPTSSSYTYNYEFEVLYSTSEDYDPAAPASSFTSVHTFPTKYMKSTDVVDFEEYSVKGIPGDAKYIAIRFFTAAGKYHYCVSFVDNIRITENDETPLLGYHVYERNNGRLTEEALADDQLSHTVDFNEKARSTQRQYYVTAVYREGESAPSEIASVTTGIEEVLASGASIAAVNGGVMVNGHNGETAYIFTLDGRMVTSMRCAEHSIINVESGVYVVRVGDDVKKVMVK